MVFIAALVAVIPPLAGHGTFDEWLYRALVLLVISCPCALVISIPLGYFGGIGAASKKGILVKGGHVLDALHNIKTVAFDKTGTLTRGVFEVTRVLPAEGASEEDVLNAARLVESRSTHPIARAIMKTAPGSHGFAPCRQRAPASGCGHQRALAPRRSGQRRLCRRRQCLSRGH